jgi:hypothetical protein
MEEPIKVILRVRPEADDKKGNGGKYLLNISSRLVDDIYAPCNVPSNTFMTYAHEILLSFPTKKSISCTYTMMVEV